MTARLTLGYLFVAGLWVANARGDSPPTTDSATSAAAKPNVLFIYVDDLGWRDCGFMGSDFYETPNIDALAAGGMVFTNAYSAASNCAPARASLLSGQYSPRHEIYNVGTARRGAPKHGKLQHISGTETLRSDIRTWAHCIRDAGYTTATIGKWHLSNDPLPYGFDVNIGGTHAGSPPRGYFPPHNSAPGLETAPEDEYLTDRLHDEAIGFIEANREQPWLLYLTHFAVHTPLQGKPELVKKYEAKSPGQLHQSAVLAAMIESLDQGIGRLINKLDELGLTENTVIVFTSDNGGYGPATSMHPLKGYKGTYYEGGIREPFFIRWPGVVSPGSRCETPIIQIDLYPTLCEITGAALPTDQPLDGVNLMPLLTQSGDLPQRPLYWHFPAYLQSYGNVIAEQRDPLYRSRPCGIVRYGDWKLHEYFEDGDLELYNLADDIGEQTNLVDKFPDQATQLHQMMIAWREATSAPVPTQPNRRYDPASEAAAIEQALKKRPSRGSAEATD
jgi:arylsulfatase A-like enzyme